MTETRVVLLGFAGMALVLVLSPVLFVWFLEIRHLAPSPDAAEAQGVNRVFDSKTGTFGPVLGIERVLPVGMKWSDAKAMLELSEFSCNQRVWGRRAIEKSVEDPVASSAAWRSASPTTHEPARSSLQRRRIAYD